jgi:hypothetical protein
MQLKQDYSILLIITLLMFKMASAQALELINGGVISDSISVPGEKDSYTFSGNSGENIMLRAADLAQSGATLAPKIELLDPDSILIDTGSGSVVGTVKHTLPKTGTYTVMVSDGSQGSTLTGLYDLYFVLAPGANEGGVLPNGGVVSDNIDLGDIDSYTFSGNAGENILLRAADTLVSASNLGPSIELYDPAGNFVNRGSGGTVGTIKQELPSSGVYTVIISDGTQGGTLTGPYDLHFVLAPGANEGGTLPNGGFVNETIDIGDLDSYTFSGTAGENIWLRAVDLTVSANTLGPSIELYAPDGSYVTRGSGGTVATVRETLEHTGIYTVVILDGTQGGTRTGPYDLHFVLVPGANEGGLLSDGASIAETIDLGDLDSYTFLASAGSEVDITVVDSAASVETLAPLIALYNPAGVYITQNVGGTTANISRTLSEDGIYTLVVADGIQGGTLSGDYNLDLNLNLNIISYAALGDSYSSGEGVFPYFDAEDGLLSGCHRSTRAYSTFIRVPGNATPISQREFAEFDFPACSGAVVNNVTASGEGQNGEPPQLAAENEIDDSRDLITLTIGGNDAQFARILALCLVHDACNEIRPFSPFSSIELGDFFQLLLPFVRVDLLDLYAEIKGAASNAVILVMDYPILVSGQECRDAQVPFSGSAKLSSSEQQWMRGANLQLNNLVAEVAASSGLHFAPVAANFEGHEVCGDLDSWINGLIPLNPKASFHPTARGQLEYANIANAYLETLAIDWGADKPLSTAAVKPVPTPMTGSNTDSVVTGASKPAFGDLEVRHDLDAPGCENASGFILPGELASIRGDGFASEESVSVSFTMDGVTTLLGVRSADSHGVLNATVPIPADLPIGNMVTIEALGAGPDSAGLLLFDLVRVAPSIDVDSDDDGVPDACDNCPDQFDVNPLFNTDTSFRNGFERSCQNILKH